MGIRTKIEQFEEWYRPFVKFTNETKGKKKIGHFAQFKNVPFQLALKGNLTKRSMVIVEGHCIVCNKVFVSPWRMLTGRIICGDKEICKNCALKYATGSKEWKEKNSKAQLIAQNKPEVIEKRNDAVRKSKLNPETIKKHSDASKKMWKSDEYRKNVLENQKLAFLNLSDDSYVRMTQKNRFYSGWYDSKYGEIYFNSSWELAYIIWCELNPCVELITRCQDKIQYTDKSGNKHIYLPDFCVKTNSGEYVVEIKGGLNPENVLLKTESAKEYYKNQKNYSLLLFNDLVRMNVLKSNHKAKEYCEQYEQKIRNLYKGNHNGKSKKNIVQSLLWEGL